MTRSTKSNPKPKPSNSLTRFQLEAIGTSWIIEIYESLPTNAKQKLLGEINSLTTNFDKNYSRFREDSLVTKMSRIAGVYTLPGDAKPMLDLYQKLDEISNGSMTPLIGQLLSDAGYDANYSLRTKNLSSPPAWDTVLEYSFPILTVKRPVLLDFGALGKGYLVDLLAELLESHDLQSFCINAGGDIRCQNTAEAVRIGLEHPDEFTEVIGVAHLHNQSLCGSAGNRRSWGKFHHIMDPYSCTSPSNLKAVWTTASTTLLADAMSTALFFVLPEILKKHYNFEYALLKSDYSLEYSSGFPGEFFTEY